MAHKPTASAAAAAADVEDEEMRLSRSTEEADKAAGAEPTDAKEPEDPVKDWRIELLSPERVAKVRRVMVEGSRVCSKCRWRHGCKDCDGEKAVRYGWGAKKQ